MSTKTASLIGATGMVGGYLLEQLISDSYFDVIRVIVRRPFPKSHPKIVIKLVDFNDYESVKLAIDGSDAVFCTIGTTQKNVKGDNELYRRIDYDIPVNAARICKETGCRKFIIVTAVGARLKSNSFYLKLKGEVEETIRQIDPGSVHIMQPSMLLGDRKEKRLMETMIQIPMNLVSVLLTGGWKKFKSIHGRVVASAMLNAAKKEDPGLFRYTYSDITTTAKIAL